MWPVFFPCVVFWERALAAADLSSEEELLSRITSEACEAALFPVSLLTISLVFKRSNFGWAVPETHTCNTFAKLVSDCNLVR